MRKLHTIPLTVALTTSAASAATVGLTFDAVRLSPADAQFIAISGQAHAVAAEGFAAGQVLDINAAGPNEIATRFDASGNPTRLGVPPGVVTVGSSINAVIGDGSSAGFVNTQGGGLRAARWDAQGNGTVLGDATLPSFRNGLRGSTALDLNGNGTVIGNSVANAGGTSFATAWDTQGNATLLGGVSGEAFNESFARGINDSGQIVGSVQSAAGGADQAVRWDTTGSATRLGDVAGLPTDGDSRANAINASGISVGRVGTSGFAQTDFAVLWDAVGVGTRLADVQGDITFTSEALDIADNGAAVGKALLASNPFGEEVIFWDADGTAHLLEDLLSADFAGYDIRSVHGIDSNGQFIRSLVTATTPLGNTEFLLLSAPIPEPLSVLAGGTAI
ncbi:MAG: hypothetical protein AAF743_12385, partial [Planctomycetota bacterium]